MFRTISLSPLTILGAMSAVLLGFESAPKLLSVEQSHSVTYNTNSIQETMWFESEFIYLTETALSPQASLEFMNVLAKEFLRSPLRKDTGV